MRCPTAGGRDTGPCRATGGTSGLSSDCGRGDATSDRVRGRCAPRTPHRHRRHGAPGCRAARRFRDRARPCYEHGSGGARAHTVKAKRKLELQLDWDPSDLREAWPTGPDNFYVMERLAKLVPDVTASGGPGRVLEVAAAEAAHSGKLSRRGMQTFVVEPSPVMMERARARMAAEGT